MTGQVVVESEQRQMLDRREKVMARRRWQKGTLIRVGNQWKCRYLKDEIRADGTIYRRHMSEPLGSLDELPTKKLALRVKDEFMRGINNNLKPTANLTFAELATKWEETVLPMHKPSSQVSERWHLKVLREFFGTMPIKDITGETVQRFISTRPNRPKTIKNQITTLRLVLRAAISWGYMEHDPAKRVKFPAPDLSQAVCYTAEQAQKIITLAPKPFDLMFGIVAETGMRGGEVTGLGVDDVDIENRKITVRRAAWAGKLLPPKTPNAVRTFTISRELVSRIKQYLDDGWKENPDRLLFATANGTPYDRQNIVRFVLRPITKTLGLPQAGMHALRHGNATELDRMGVPVRVRTARLGHSRFATTMGYTHMESADDERAAEELSRILYPKLTQTEVTDTK